MGCSISPLQRKSLTSIQESLRLSQIHNAIQQKVRIIRNWGKYLDTWKDFVWVLRLCTTSNFSAQRQHGKRRTALTGSYASPRTHQPYQLPDLISNTVSEPQSYQRVEADRADRLLLWARWSLVSSLTDAALGSWERKWKRQVFKSWNCLQSSPTSLLSLQGLTKCGFNSTF